MRLLLFLLTFPLFARAEWESLFPDSDDPALFHHVHVISGNLHLFFEDAFVQGAKPLTVFRTYSSVGALERSSENFDLLLKKEQGGWMFQGGWTFFPHTNLFVELSMKREEFKAHLLEPNGSALSYSYSHAEGEHIYLRPDRLLSQYSGRVSKRSNPSYNLLRLSLKEGKAVLFMPDGGQRIYHWGNHSAYCLYLAEEILPSQHKIVFSYDQRRVYRKKKSLEKRFLRKIQLQNPGKTKTFSSVEIRFAQPEPKGSLQLYLQTSDQRHLSYKTSLFEKREYLSSVESTSRPTENISLIPGRKGVGARISSLQLGGKVPFRAHYYKPQSLDQERKWAKNPKRKEFHIDKVEEIEAPVGPNGEGVVVAHFTYFPHRTDVRDAEGLLIRYHHDSEKLLSIEYFDEKDRLYSSQKFYWEGPHLICKAMFDEKNTPLFAKTFLYEKGYIVEEALWGRLTGNTVPPLQIDSRGHPSGAEKYQKTYTYSDSPFPLLKMESEEVGPTYEYFYKSGTDLLEAKFTKDKEGKIFLRTFFFYDSDHLLIREIFDDGNSPAPEDYTSVTERLEKEYARDPVSGLPISIAEFYWDPFSRGRKFLKKTVFAYLNQKVCKEEVWDAEETLRYTIETDYDNFGLIKRKTTPLGRENRYYYNAQGYLETSKEVGSPAKIFCYDKANRLISCEEPETRKRGATFYDVKGRILSETDMRGNETLHLYNAFGRPRALNLPACKDENGEIYKPSVHFESDVQGNIVSATMPRGEVTRTVYNLWKKPIRIIQADGEEMRHFYFRNGTLAKTLYSDGTEIHYTYDLFQRMTSKRLFSKEKAILYSENWEYTPLRLRCHTDPRGLITKYNYDGAGRKISQEAEGRSTTFAYDSLGFLERTDNGVISLVQKHNVEGLVEEQWEEDREGHIENRMKFFYDSENRKEKAIRTTARGEATDFFCYDERGRLCAHTNPEGHVTRFHWDEFFENDLGQKVLQKTTIDPLYNMTIETYDVGERLIAKETRTPQGQIAFREKFSYDRSGNRAQRISFLYSNGEYQKELCTRWNYDAMGRVCKEIESEQKITLFDYDSRGRLKQKILPNGIQLHFSYDAADRLEECKSSEGKIHLRYSYEKGPDPTQIHDLSQGRILERKYNPFGELLFETNSQGLSTLWEYDSLGRCTSFTLPDGSSIHYPTQGAHVKAIQRKDSLGHLLYEHRYLRFDPNGHVAEEELIFGSARIQTERDFLERPLSQRAPQMKQTVSYTSSGLVQEVQNSLFGAKTYEYDALHQLRREGGQHYQFDSLGNSSQFSINDLNQVVATPDCVLIYDTNGNPKERLSADSMIQYQFDSLGRLIEIAIPQKRLVQYSYDPLSRLFSKEIYRYADSSWQKERKIFYLYDQEREIATLDEQGHFLELKILGLGIKGDCGAAVALELGDHIFAPLHDFCGNIIALLSPDGSLAEKYEMDAFGKEKCNASPRSPWRFSSKRSEEGLVFFGARFYDPSLGRWLSPDPAGFAEGINLYAYVQNSPLNRLDLFGLFSEDPFPLPTRINVAVSAIPRFPGFTTLVSHGATIDGVLVDFVICCGHWHKLQFTPEELNTNTLNLLDHFQELIPQEGTTFGLVSVGNGINTSLAECFKMCDKVGRKIGGTLLIGLHNPSNGVAKDIERTFQERRGFNTKIVCLMRQFMVATAEMLQNVNKNALWLCIPHSENGVIIKRAIEGMSSEQKEILQRILHIFAVAPAEPLRKDQGASVINVYSKKDYVTGFGPCGYAKIYSNNENYDIRILECKSNFWNKNLFIADHGFLEPTYRPAWENQVKDLQKEIGFYGTQSYQIR